MNSTQENKMFEVDGSFENVVYEIEKEISKIDISEMSDVEGLTFRDIATMTAELLADDEMPNAFKNQYTKGTPILNNKYYIKASLSLLFGVAKLVVHIYRTTINPDTIGFDETINQLIDVGFSIKGAINRIPREHFCAFLAAHTIKNHNNFVSVERIYDYIRANGCPFSNPYEKAFGVPCSNMDYRCHCYLSKRDICKSLNALGSDYDIKEIKKDHLYLIT